MVSENLGSF